MAIPLYVSGLLLRVVQIGVKACIDVTLYGELFITSIIEKHFLSPLVTKDNFDRFLVIHSWITLVPPCHTWGNAHIKCSTQQGITNKAYGRGIEDDLRPFFFFCRGRSIESYSTSHLSNQARTPS